MDTKKDSFHSFDVSLAVEIGVEKAILIGYIQYWISENEKRKSAFHFQQGEYWTYGTAKELAQKHPYFKDKSIARWTDELVKSGWLKKENFNKNNIDRTSWFARGERMVEWFSSPIPQNEKMTPQNDQSVPHNEESKAQNKESVPQNEKCNNKDTITNSSQTTVTESINTPAEADDDLVIEVDAEEVDPDDKKNAPNPQFRPPPSPADLSDDDLDELETFTRKLQSNSRLVYALATTMNLRGEVANHWIARFVTKQWTSDNLKDRKNKELISHCISWIDYELKKPNDQRQSTPGHANRNGHRQSGAETGSEIDRLVNELLGS